MSAAPQAKPRIAVHKFTSCDGCQLAFLNLGETLVQLAEMADIVHFAEAGPIAPGQHVDVAFVEGSITTPHELERVRQVRENCTWLVTIGACATAGGLQALRGLADARTWISEIYASPEYIDSLATSTPIADHVKVDLELWGCPVNSRQVLGALRALMSGVMPAEEEDKVCLECKRRQNICVVVARDLPCMGPVTRTGCGALCPSFGRDCYGCYGPAENVNTRSLSRRLAGLGLVREEIARRYLSINNGAPAFRRAGTALEDPGDG
ncbi:MAG TPA: sulfhydrogenase subunit delta [Noviherbaspirillum sp.]|uniref:NADH-quinone oxidoreductase subunit B family protein n=1 Tax=Noviherbaspirillum sp. TaxID=1926288 RepID=UPI002B48BE19|nr:sulfhydrogenase subunit delta [Noviherbaspirillum sp.]HJV88571.1 sulfhydrogenase subunit delta [Noviherbaspirillum sp.]